MKQFQQKVVGPIGWTSGMHRLHSLHIEQTPDHNGWSVHLVDSNGSKYFHTNYTFPSAVLHRIDYLKERFPHVATDELTAQIVALQLENKL